MKLLQISATALTALLLPTLSTACSWYTFCLCQNSDGSFNDAATKQVCPGSALRQFDDGRLYCAGPGGGYENCDFRNSCHANGATGDSNCWEKS